jgi:hypothetical protein
VSFLEGVSSENGSCSADLLHFREVPQTVESPVRAT